MAGGRGGVTAAGWSQHPSEACLCTETDSGYLQIILSFPVLALLGKSVCVSAVSHPDAQTGGQNPRQGLIDHNKCINMQQGCSLPAPWPLYCARERRSF